MNQVVRLFKAAALTLTAAADGFLAACRARNLSPRTLDYYRYRLQAFERFLEPHGTPPVSGITARHVRDFLVSELERGSPTTAAHSYITLSAFFAHLEREGQIDANPMSRVEKPKRRKTVIQTLSAAQVEALLRTCGRDFYGVRDRAALLILLDCGLRASELCGLEVADASLEEQTLLVTGKGNKERVVPFGTTVRSALVSYLARPRQSGDGRLFVNHYAEAFTRWGLRDTVSKRGRQAGVTGVRCSPHVLRHTCAVMYLRNGGDVFTLQKLLGHEDLTMTRRYAELSQTDVQEKHRLYSPMDALRPKTKTGRTRLR